MGDDAREWQETGIGVKRKLRRIFMAYRPSTQAVTGSVGPTGQLTRSDPPQCYPQLPSNSMSPLHQTRGTKPCGSGTPPGRLVYPRLECEAAEHFRGPSVWLRCGEHLKRIFVVIGQPADGSKRPTVQGQASVLRVEAGERPRAELRLQARKGRCPTCFA